MILARNWIEKPFDFITFFFLFACVFVYAHTLLYAVPLLRDRKKKILSSWKGEIGFLSTKPLTRFSYYLMASYLWHHFFATQRYFFPSVHKRTHDNVIYSTKLPLVFFFTWHSLPESLHIEHGLLFFTDAVPLFSRIYGLLELNVKVRYNLRIVYRWIGKKKGRHRKARHLKSIFDLLSQVFFCLPERFVIGKFCYRDFKGTGDHSVIPYVPFTFLSILFLNVVIKSINSANLRVTEHLANPRVYKIVRLKIIFFLQGFGDTNERKKARKCLWVLLLLSMWL